MNSNTFSGKVALMTGGLARFQINHQKEPEESRNQLQLKLLSIERIKGTK